MSAYFLFLLLFAAPLPQDDVKDALAHAEALYYEARFNESIQLLSRVDSALPPQPGKIQDKVAVKLQLALAHIGLNETADARTLFRELYVLDPEYRIDTQEFSPKIVALANEAKVEADEVRCKKFQTDAQSMLETSDGTSLIDLIRSKKASCSQLAMLEPLTAELLYKSGVDLYKRGDLPAALIRFRNVVELVPRHELATQYIDLIESKQQISFDRLFIDWQKSFNAHDLAAAAKGYKAVKPLNSNAATQMREEYRKAVGQLVPQWKQACTTGDIDKMAEIHDQASQLLPEQGIADDLLKQMDTCYSTKCLQMSSQLAMARIKTRVNPNLPGYAVRTPMEVRVAVKIDDKGNVNISSIQGGTPQVVDAVRSAVSQWKFNPVTDENGLRCVEAEIPMMIKPPA